MVGSYLLAHLWLWLGYAMCSGHLVVNGSVGYHFWARAINCQQDPPTQLSFPLPWGRATSQAGAVLAVWILEEDDAERSSELTMMDM